MASLAELFSSLTNEDGSPDVIARRQHFDSLVTQLLPFEGRRIQAQISAKFPPMIDFVSKLPVEIVICISDYLTLADLAATRLVSKAWLGCFTERPDLVHHLTRKHFRMIFEHNFVNATAAEQLDLFKTLSRKQNDINRGSYHDMAQYINESRDWYPVVVKYPKPSTVYFDENRIAWTSDEMIYLKDVISGETKRFVTPEKTRIKGKLMRGDCLLAMCNPSTDFYAWSIATGECSKIRLPSLLNKCDVKDGTVILSLRNGHMLEWKIGHRLRELKVPVLTPEKLVFLCCDPFWENAFIRCFWQLVDAVPTTGSDPAKKALRLVAERFVHERVVSTVTTDIPLSEEGQTRFEYLPSETMTQITKHRMGMREDGIFQLILCRSLVNYDLVSKEEEKCQTKRKRDYSFIRVVYNTMEGHWSKNAYAVPGGFSIRDEDNLDVGFDRRVEADAVMAGILFSGEQALVPYQRNSFFVVIGIEPIDGDWMSRERAVPELPFICGRGKKMAPHKLHKLVSRKLGLRFAWAEDVDDIQQAGGRLHIRDVEQYSANTSLSREWKICGNSTLTVLLHKEEYVVWSHDEDIVLKGYASDDDSDDGIGGYPLIDN